jgi:hypothetical protein
VANANTSARGWRQGGAVYCAVVLSPQHLRQLGDVGGDAAGIVAGEQFGRRAPTGVILEID